MADEETRIEWEKSRRIEAERQKAVQAMAKEEKKRDGVSLSYLDPGATKVKGFSRDTNVVLADAERMANRAMFLVIGGVALMIIGGVGGIVSTTYGLGLAGVILSIPSMVGLVCLGAGALMAMVTMGCEVYFRVKTGRKPSSALWTAAIALAVVAVYFVVQWLVMRFA